MCKLVEALKNTTWPEEQGWKNNNSMLRVAHCGDLPRVKLEGERDSTCQWSMCGVSMLSQGGVRTCLSGWYSSLSTQITIALRPELLEQCQREAAATINNAMRQYLPSFPCHFVHLLARHHVHVSWLVRSEFNSILHTHIFEDCLYNVLHDFVKMPNAPLYGASKEPRKYVRSINPMNYLFLAQHRDWVHIIYLGNTGSFSDSESESELDVNDRVTISHERSRARDVLVTPRGLNAQTRPRSTDAQI